MRLTDLNPEWIGHGGEGVTCRGAPVPRRERTSISFNCPCGCPHPVVVSIANPEDGLGPIPAGPHPSWQRTGDTFESLTLTPSIQRVYPHPCWHGFVTNGEIITC